MAADVERILITRYFEEHSIVEANITSFNNFIEAELPAIIEENKEVEPTIIPANVEEFKIRLDKIWVTKPEITEAATPRPASVQPFRSRMSINPDATFAIGPVS